MSHIHTENLVVEFPIYGGRSRSLKNIAIRAATGGIVSRDADDRLLVRAIDRISLDWRAGDRIGLIGHNGSGKTTLLRTLAGVYEPCGGEISVQGRIATMLSLTLGMDNEATGYENIFLRGTIMGLSRSRIEAMAGEICEFSELDDYIHMPMRTYSSGMSMRLAFAISTSVEADIILMDEWLSVGDKAFAVKAQARLSKLIDRAKILVLASHSEESIRVNCNKVVRMEHGRIVEEV